MTNHDPLALQQDEKDKQILDLKQMIKGFSEALNQIAKAQEPISKEDIDKHSGLSEGFYKTIKGKNGSYTKPDWHGMADFLIDKYKIIAHQSYCYYWDENHYQYLDQHHLKHIVCVVAGNKIKPKDIRSFVDLTLSKSYGREKLLKATSGLINCKNGILNLSTKELLASSPDYFFKYALDIVYDPDAKAPMFQSFLHSIFENYTEYINITNEIFGYCLIGGPQYLHKCFVLSGTGRNGKGTWQKILQALLGSKNVSHVSLGMINKPFSAVTLEGKLANISGETPNAQINAEVFKAITSGETITAAHKGKPEFEFECHTRFIFAANEMPIFDEASYGLRKRLFFIRFEKVFDEASQDHFLAEKIIASEMSGILNLAIDGMADLKVRGQLAPSIGHQELMEKFYLLSDSVYDWCDERIYYDPEKNFFIKTSTLYYDYASSCVEKGKKPLSQNKFVERLINCVKEKHKISLEQTRPRSLHLYRGPDSMSQEKRPRGFVGLVLNNSPRVDLVPTRSPNWSL